MEIATASDARRALATGRTAYLFRAGDYRPRLLRAVEEAEGTSGTRVVHLEGDDALTLVDSTPGHGYATGGAALSVCQRCRVPLPTRLGLCGTCFACDDWTPDGEWGAWHRDACSAG